LSISVIGGAVSVYPAPLGGVGSSVTVQLLQIGPYTLMLPPTNMVQVLQIGTLPVVRSLDPQQNILLVPPLPR